MKQLGRIHWMVAVALAGLIFLIGLYFFVGESASSAANRFMTALAKQDPKALTDMTYLGGDSREDMEKQWTFACRIAAQHYLFVWFIDSEHSEAPGEVVVAMDVYRNFGPTSSPEHFELPMIKEDGKWKVRVQAMNRQMYPDLPR